jgi:hypothetical protein
LIDARHHQPTHSIATVAHHQVSLRHPLHQFIQLNSLIIATMASETPESLASGHDSQVTVNNFEQNQQTAMTSEKESATLNSIERGSSETPLDALADNNDVPGQVDEDGLAQSKGRDLFMLLPPELRIQVYKICLLGSSIEIRQNCHDSYYVDQCSTWTEPALLGVTKLIRHETSEIYYAGNSVKLHVNISEIPKACDWLAAIARCCGSQPFRLFSFVVYAPRWADFECLTSLAKLYFTTNIELQNPRSFHPLGCNGSSLEHNHFAKFRHPNPCTFPSSRCFTIFRMACSKYSTFHRVLDPIVALGRKAREERWSEDRFKSELTAWREEMNASNPVRQSKMNKAKQLKQQRIKLAQARERDIAMGLMLGNGASSCSRISK